MKMLYDYQTFNEQNYGGISRYFAEMMRLFGTESESTMNLASLFSNNYYLNLYGLNRLRFLPTIDINGKRKAMKLINKQYAKHILKRGDFDLFHPTYYDPYFLKHLRGKPYVITVFDLILEIYKEEYYKANQKPRDYMRESISNATHIISISENTKKDIVNCYGIESNRITTVYLASTIVIGGSDECSLRLPKEYLLFVGHRGQYKNFEILVRSISEILRNNRLPLVCIGGAIPTQEEKRLLQELKVQEYVVFFPWIRDDDLAFLYGNALAFIFPSKYEGFGIPVLEAFACGCPVLASNSSSLPEVAGNAAIFFDPYSTDSIRHCVDSFLKADSSIRADLIAKGYEREKDFSWKNTFQSTLGVYKRTV